MDRAPTVRAELSGAQSVDRALALLTLIGRERADGLPLGEVVALSGMSKPTVRRLLLALIRAGFVEQDARTRHYCLGEESFVTGLMAQRRHGLLDLAMGALERLAARTLDTSFLTVRRDRQAICLHRQEGTFPVRTHALQTGDRHPLGIGAGSLAILALLPDEAAEAALAANAGWIAASYPGYSPAIIRADLARARTDGFALNPGRVVASSWGIGVAFRYPDGRVAGALSLAAIDSRMQPPRQGELAALLAGEAAALEGRLAGMFGTKRAAPQMADAGQP